MQGKLVPTLLSVVSFHGVAAFGGAMCALQDRPRILRQDYSQKRHRNRKGKGVSAQNAAGGLPAALACGKESLSTVAGICNTQKLGSDLALQGKFS